MGLGKNESHIERQILTSLVFFSYGKRKVMRVDSKFKWVAVRFYRPKTIKG